MKKQRSYKGKKNPAYKDGRTLKKHYCVLCNKNEIYFYSKHQRCPDCYHKTQIKTSKNYCCVDCGGLISSVTALYGGGRCNVCKSSGENNHMFGVRRFGKESPRYIDGRTEIKYPFIFNNKLKLKIRTRDDFTCQCCKLTEKESKNKFHEVLHVHHIDYNKENCKETNLITLCRICNVKANSDRDYWFAYYTYLIKEYIHG
jgi:hypothetical protein